MIEAPVHEELLPAADAIDAIAIAKRTDIDMTGLKANAVYLVDPNGHVVWSLRLADVSDDAL